MKVLEMVEQKKLNRDDLERINQLLKAKLLNSLDPEMIPKFLQYRSAKFADLISNVFRSDVHYFQTISAFFSSVYAHLKKCKICS